TYSYTVSAYDHAGNESARSAAITCKPVDLTPPAVPAGLAASASPTSVSLTWTANTEPDLAGYRLYRNGSLVFQGSTGAFTDGSDTNAACSHSAADNSVQCTCNPGYQGSGMTCTDDCTVSNGGCDTNATCSHSAADNTVQCVCNTGYAGSGTSCTDDCTAGNG